MKSGASQAISLHVEHSPRLLLEAAHYVILELDAVTLSTVETQVNQSSAPNAPWIVPRHIKQAIDAASESSFRYITSVVRQRRKGQLKYILLQRDGFQHTVATNLRTLNILEGSLEGSLRVKSAPWTLQLAEAGAQARKYLEKNVFQPDQLEAFSISTSTYSEE